MFTGLIERVGTISEIEEKLGYVILRVNLKQPEAYATTLGESIAVNGCCLTVTSMDDKSFTFDVSQESLSKTNLGQLKVGSPVNLERALRMGDRLGGHMVSGHIDGVATVVGLTQGEKWLQFDIKVPENLSKYIVNQGSIALDGVSLTVGEINDANLVTVWLIPETLERTNLAAKQPGELVNVEVDLIAKYVERLITKGDKS
jgi:riboflavin synthase